ncbi:MULTISPECIES: arsenic resistance N-acetyltransferase ArsN2 [Asticcacaulis]|jgi:amino-acid N-acetyltransferase|uniref:arsenic resistance N-acetyltransferase ArsN2 n=1 Tax=Asticcacaulis TaxID=76890 RepID=UPI001AE90FB0|nr:MULTISPECIES: arsenic resistance N-acetyltransferase ArsN2 [Asticcacaulis]MBP2160555.1 N-acetylglutamate synthase-like GNAT family acetyltransferase [Asticcacaulis solisilvae]MDR6801600.1 N-acetylglutamate synthase-like GNAT family acetyltransferase [Asticcacaulis sp. BE141]
MLISVDPLDAGLRAALADEGLPVSDLGADHQRMWCDVVDGKAVGYGGIERHGDAALLRSLVILPDHKGRGHGAALVAQIVAEAGVAELWLLTNTAAAFFARLGWTVRDRADAPPAIAASAEFASLCPASAVCMSYRV